MGVGWVYKRRRGVFSINLSMHCQFLDSVVSQRVTFGMLKQL